MCCDTDRWQKVVVVDRAWRSVARRGSLGKAGDGDADADVHACTLGLLCLPAWGRIRM